MPERRTIPAEGTYLRQIYDTLKAGRGKPVRLEYPPDIPAKKAATHQNRALDQLRNFYGCEIRNVSPHVYVLEGEWFGSRYHDYLMEKRNELA